MLGHVMWAPRLLLAAVASTGNDARPCTSAAAPCRTLQRAIIATPAGGEVRVLDTIYGGGTIDRSLTISADGSTIIGRIFINNANAVVALRDLHLNGAGSRDTGIRIIAASAVHIERCTVERFTEFGIASEAPNAEIFMTESISRNNGTGLAVGVLDSNFASRLVVDDSRFLNNAENGVLINKIAVTFTQSIMSGNHANGISMIEAIGTFEDTLASDNQVGAGFSFFDSEATLESSVSRGNSVGLLALASDEPRFVTISNSVFANNRNKGIFTEDTVRTRGNNTVVGNGTDIDGTLMPLAGQ